MAQLLGASLCGFGLLSAAYAAPLQLDAATVTRDIVRTSVYDYLRRNAGMHDSYVVQWLTRDRGLQQLAAQGRAIPAGGGVVRLRFEDGSTRDFHCSSTDYCTPVRAGSRDSEGSYVPDREDLRVQFQDERRTAVAANGLVALIESWGIAICPAAATDSRHDLHPPVAAPLRLECNYDGNRKYSCSVLAAR